MQIYLNLRIKSVSFSFIIEYDENIIFSFIYIDNLNVNEIRFIIIFILNCHAYDFQWQG